MEPTSPPRAARPGSAGLRALGFFWLALLVAGVGGVAWLDRLGPLGDTTADGATPTTDPAVPDRRAEAPASPPGPASGPPPGAAADAPAPQRGAVIPEPDPALLDRLRDGALPRVADDGRAPWRTYARPFDQGDRRPRIGMLVAGLGISESATEAAIQRLPGAVSLAFSPYGLRLAEFAALARAAGHEVLVAVPMEPVGFPLNDPGPQALLTGLAWGENSQRLTWALSRFAGYVGATNVLGPTLRGERFSASPEAMRPLLDVLRTRGLLFIDGRPGGAAPQGLPARSVDVVLDDRPTRAEIEQRLADLERIARERGAALGLSGAGTLALERIAAWAAGVEERGFALAPVSALLPPQERQAQR
jgi:polysaccharide deacetylase 2 family uncharacterized protein YibQ